LLVSFKCQKDRKCLGKPKQIRVPLKVIRNYPQQVYFENNFEIGKGMINRIRGLPILQNFKSIMSSYWIRGHLNLGKPRSLFSEDVQNLEIESFPIFWGHFLSRSAVDQSELLFKRSKVKHLLKLLEKTIFNI